ncbi:MAG: chromosome segregation protein SMC [Ignavibacteriae bacterium HGW-Ignavibacteriae-4]|nr:MAG: chromosome segregation protein SMC [Ignavibacteriae bacterium HGW-Ignavibacteriae-4]
MFLSELEISGFKSFAGKTKFKFADGITAIVGPNGCGKSNVVDAVRWVLGEQKTSVLRSDSMDSVIFNGTSKRNPLGMAEVTMKLENNKAVLPSEYDSIQISRRLFRDGASNYLLNKTKCRLKDINDLFMDTGLGPDSYSVIELKMVEALINGKMDERRRMIEEAAGVTRYKQRRKETSNKLQRVQEDLERINDILSEVEVNVKRLSRQAKKTKKYNELSEQLKSIESDLLKNEYASFKSKNSSIKQFILELSAKIETLEVNLESYENELVTTREDKSIYDQKINELVANENILKNQIAESTRLISVNKEKLISLNNINNRLIEDNANSERFIQKLTNDIAQLNDKLAKREEDTNTQNNSLEELKTDKQLRKSELDEARELANADIDVLNKLKNSIQSSYSIIENNEKRIEKISSKIENYKEEISQENKEIEIKNNLVIELSNSLKNLNADLNDKNENYQITKNKLEEVTNELNRLNDTISDLRSNISGKKAQLEFLESLSADDDTTQMLINSKDWDKPVNITLLEELISADEKYNKAISSVLGAYRNLIVVDTAKQAESAFELLKKKNLSKRAIICRELIPTNTNQQSIAGVELLTDIIDTDDDIKSLLVALFGQVAITESKDNAYALTKSKVNAAVTLDGFLINKNGILRGGGSTKNETANLGKQKRIKDITKQLTELQTSLDSMMSKKEELTNKKNELNPERLLQEVKKLENEIKQIENTKLQSTMKIDSLKNNIEMYEKSIESSNKEFEDLQNEIKELQSSIEERKEKLKSAELNKEDKLKGLNNAEIRYSKANEELQAAEILMIQLKSDFNNIKNEIERSNGQLRAEKNRVQSRKDQIVQNEKSNIEIDSTNKELESKLELDNRKLIEVSNQKDQSDEKRKSIEEKQISLTNELHTKRNEYNKLKDSFHKEDISRSEYETKMESLENRAFEAYDLQLAQLDLEYDENFPITESKHQVSELKNGLVNLGSINFEAVQEYDEQNERLVFLTKQIKDLTESEKTLKETIKEINITAEERFETTFKQIKENFSNLFKKLFSDEAFADISLSGDNILESNIEITAKPPGKKPRSIDMLSGGEKTLTAIALLFAIYLVKPSPFCILDEVDAPLDDANLRRFNSLIKEFSLKTQFLIVTHMKITMEAADTLYGITQQEVGISKIVSVNLKKDEIL